MQIKVCMFENSTQQLKMSMLALSRSLVVSECAAQYMLQQLSTKQNTSFPNCSPTGIPRAAQWAQPILVQALMKYIVHRR